MRTAGVRRIKLSGAEVEIAAPEPETVVVKVEASTESYGDPLSDPRTFGTEQLPGFPRRHRESDA